MPQIPSSPAFAIPPMAKLPFQPMKMAPPPQAIPKKPLAPMQSAAWRMHLNDPATQMAMKGPENQFNWQNAATQFDMRTPSSQANYNSPGTEFDRGAPPKLASALQNCMDNQNPSSGCPDPNSGRPVDLRGDEDEDLPLPPPVTAPGRPPEAPLTRDLLYKGAKDEGDFEARLKAFLPVFLERRKACEARAQYPELYKLAVERIGKVKQHPSPMKVTAIGEGDYKRLKVKPWTLQGEDALKDIKPHN